MSAPSAPAAAHSRSPRRQAHVWTGARRFRLLAPAAALVAALVPGLATAQSATLFRGVRVFDGDRLLPAQDVLVEGARIARVGRSIAAPAGARVVDGAGKTLLPGFIDAHTHSYGDALRSALPFGVTTELDMFSEHASVKAMREEQRAGKATGRSDIVSAGTLVTAPGGHGTEYGLTIPTISSPDSAQAFVDARIAEGSDFIKIVLDDGHTYGMKMPTLDVPTMRAVIDAAHRRGKLAVVHVGDLAGARAAIGAGADGLVHLFVDTLPDAGFGRHVAAARPRVAGRAFVIPTLTVLKSITGVGGGATLLSDARVRPYLSRTDSISLASGFPRRPGAPATHYDAAVATVKQLKAAGVRILAGTDAGNPGTSHGAALHRELELLVEAGLSPAEALAAATAVPSAAFGLKDRGRIAAGLRADLVLVNGDPTSDITATRAIEGVWKEGVPADRAAFAKAVADAKAAAGQLPKGAESGLVSDFEDGAPNGAPTAKFGAGWQFSNDAMAGGASKGEMSVVDGGAGANGKALRVTGTIDAKVPYAWAGAMFYPGAQPMTPANLSSKKTITFRAKGDGQTYRVMVFAQSRGFTPLMQTFTAVPEWKEYSFPISAFGGIDGKDMMALLVAGGPKPGTFEILIDDVRIH